MKRKTSNLEHRTLNAESSEHKFKLNEAPNSEYGERKEPRFDLEDRLLEFAIEIVELTETLPTSRAGNHIAAQLLRCGTSPHAHHGEVESAESRKDFVHKLKICLKELRETRRWLQLLAGLRRMDRLPRLSACLGEAEELIRIFVASVRTTKRNET